MNSLKQDEVEELQAAFNLFSNKKKELDAEDLKAIMRQLGKAHFPCLSYRDTSLFCTRPWAARHFFFPLAFFASREAPLVPPLPTSRLLCVRGAILRHPSYLAPATPRTLEWCCFSLILPLFFFLPALLGRASVRGVFRCSVKEGNVVCVEWSGVGGSVSAFAFLCSSFLRCHVGVVSRSY